MKNCISIITVLLVLIASLCSAQKKQAEAVNINNENFKSWTLENSLSARRFKTGGNNDASIFPSPDGNYFYFVSWTADLKTDRNIYKLEFFSSKEVLLALNNKKTNNTSYIKPFKTLTVSNKLFFPIGASSFGWSADSKSILFQLFDDIFGGNAGETNKICRFDISEDRMKVIKSVELTSNIFLDRNRIFYNKDISTIAFSLFKKIAGDSLYNIYPQIEVTPSNVTTLYLDGIKSKGKATFYVYRDGKISELPENYIRNENQSWIIPPNLWLSPNGSKVIIIQPTVNVPSLWSKNYSVNKAFNDKTSKDSMAEFGKFMMIDCDNTNNIHPLIDAPVGMNTAVGKKMEGILNVLWTADNQDAILVNSALPIERNQTAADTMAYILSVNIKNGKYQVLEPLVTSDGTVNDVSWNKKGDELLITFVDSKNNSHKMIGYKRAGEQWIKDLSPKIDTTTNKSKESQLTGGLKVVVRENADTAPMVIASNGKREIYLTEPDTALQNVYIAPSKTIKWSMPDGRVFTGGLTLPKGYESLKPLPLVIQNYGYEPDLFKPDGGTTSGYLVQTLVANGFAVLQLDLSMVDLQKKYGTEYEKHYFEEGSDYVQKLDAVVEMLVDSGLIDSKKIGTIGFSRGGYETLYAITHPGKTIFAAAISLDGLTGTFTSYLTEPYVYSAMVNPLYEDWHNGPFWSNKSDWLQEEVTFNVDRVKTPLLLTTHCLAPSNIRSAINNYSDILGAFKINKKPAEFMIYPRGTHNIFRPRERYAAMSSTLDWFNFWLKGVEDPAPSKAEKYVRWREFRIMQNAVLKEKKEG